MSQKEKPESGQAGTETDRLLADLATEIRRPVAPANAENAAISGVCKCGAPIDEHEFVPEAASETPSDVRRNGVSGYPVCPKPRNAGNAAPDAGACPLCKGGPLKGHVAGCAALAGEPLDLAGSGESSMTVKSPEKVKHAAQGEKCGYRKLFYKRSVIEELLAVHLGIPVDDFTCQWQVDANGVFLGVVVCE